MADKYVKVVEVEQGDKGFPGHGFMDFAGWVLAIMEQIPKEYRDKADIDFITTDRYGSYYLTIEVGYWREETAEEVAERLAKEEQKRLDFIENEYREFQRLRKIFGDSRPTNLPFVG